MHFFIPSGPSAVRSLVIYKNLYLPLVYYHHVDENNNTEMRAYQAYYSMTLIYISPRNNSI